MPEGDTIHRIANQLRAAFAGHIPDQLLTPHPRFNHAHWTQRLADRRLVAVQAHGKHLFLVFEGGLSIHSHLRMTGRWSVVARAGAWSRTPRRAWLVLARDTIEAVQLDGPVLELLTAARRQLDQRLSQLGPDILGDRFDETAFLRRLRESDPQRTIGEALLDQRTVAGIGNLWKSEACFAAQVSPWRPVRTITDEQVLKLLMAVRWRMQEAVREGTRGRSIEVYNRRGKPCPRCVVQSRVASHTQGDENRLTFWCPRCQV